MNRLKALLAVLAIAAVPLSAAHGQATQSFNPTGATTRTVSNVSARVAFATAGPTALITNTGTVAAYLAFGGTAVVATTAGYLIDAGCSIAFNINGQADVAAITAASTTNLRIITGGGLPTLPQSACVQAVTISGTVSENLAQVNGQTVNVGPGAAGTGTQRVTTSTDSTIGTVTAVTAITNALPAGTNIIGNVRIDQTTPGTTNGVVVNSGTVTAVTTVTNPVGVKGADGAAIASATNPVNIVQSPTATAGLTGAQLGAAATNLVLKASAGNLVSLSITVGATSGYLMIDNATSAPVDGAVTPLFCIPIISNGTNGSASLDFGLPGKPFSTGITAVFSTTGCFTQTASNAAFISGSVK